MNSMRIYRLFYSHHEPIFSPSVDKQRLCLSLTLQVRGAAMNNVFIKVGLAYVGALAILTILITQIQGIV